MPKPNPDLVFRTIYVEGTLNLSDTELAESGGNVLAAVEKTLGPTGFWVDKVEKV